MLAVHARHSPSIELLEPRLQMARPDPSIAENVRFRLPLATDTSVHYYYDRDDTTAATAWNGTSQTYDGHHGTDFSGGPRGKPVYAAADGILIATVDGFPDQGGTANGNYVRINHGNDRNGLPINSVYLHFNAGTVTTKPLGSLITAGEQIGGVGTSGNSTGLHLHFETQLNRVAFDPYKATGSSETSWWTNQGSGSPSTTPNTAKLIVGDPVRVYDLPNSSISVRGPAAAGSVVGTEPNLSTGTILEGPTFGAIGGDYNNNLWVWYRVAWANGLTGWSAQNWLQKVADVTPPTISSTFNFETSPNSLSLTFSEDVASSITQQDFTVTRADGSTVGTRFGYDAATRRATLFFSAALPDGNYRAHIDATSINDAAGNPLAQDYDFNFHALAGDVNHDRFVNFDDLILVAQNYGKTGLTFSGGNLNYSADGKVDFDDLIILAQHYNTTLAAPTLTIATKAERKSSSRIAALIL